MPKEKKSHEATYRMWKHHSQLLIDLEIILHYKILTSLYTRLKTRRQPSKKERYVDKKMESFPSKLCPIIHPYLFIVCSLHQKSPSNITLVIPLKAHSTSGSQPKVRPSENTPVLWKKFIRITSIRKQFKNKRTVKQTVLALHSKSSVNFKYMEHKSSNTMVHITVNRVTFSKKRSSIEGAGQQRSEWGK